MRHNDVVLRSQQWSNKIGEYQRGIKAGINKRGLRKAIEIVWAFGSNVKGMKTKIFEARTERKASSRTARITRKSVYKETARFFCCVIDTSLLTDLIFIIYEFVE